MVEPGLGLYLRLSDGVDPMTHPPWIPYTQGAPVPMGMVRCKWVWDSTSPHGTWPAFLWEYITHYQHHPDHQLIADMRDDLVMHLNAISGDEPRRALILRAEAVVGRAPGLPQWLVEYLDGGGE